MLAPRFLEARLALLELGPTPLFARFDIAPDRFDRALERRDLRLQIDQRLRFCLASDAHARRVVSRRSTALSGSKRPEM